MILKNLQLRGIRSWEEGEIAFEEGFTAIVGPKGAGKSSIITAVEFALFGDEAFRDYDGLMREDARSSEAVLQVEDQGKGLVITRGLVRTGDRISQDPERLRLGVDGAVQTVSKAGDLNRDVKAFLRVDDKLLEHTCLARQEELKQLLNMDARSRKEVVDSLLGFDSFEAAWKGLGEIIRDREGYLRRLREEAAKYDLELLSKSYEENLGQIEDLKRRNRKVRERHEFEREKLEFVGLELKAFDRDARWYYEAKKEIEEKRRRLAEGVARAEGFKGKISSLKQSLEDMEEEEKQLEGQIGGLWADLAKIGYDEERTMPSLKKSLETLNKTILEASNAISVDEKMTEDEQSKESALSDREACPYCGQPLASHEAKRFRQERQKHVANLRERIKKNSIILDSSRQLLKMYRDSGEALDRFLYRIERLQSQIQSTRLQISDAQRELDAAQSVNNVLENQIKMKEVSLPTYDEALHSKKREEWMNQSTKVNNLQIEIQQTQTSLQNLETSLTDLSNKIQEGRRTHEKTGEYRRMIEDLKHIRGGCRAVLPTLRTLYLKSIERNIQKTYDDFNPASPFTILVDEDYTPTISVGNYARSYRDLSGGERTEIALAYRIGLGNAIYEARTGTPMDLLILDEPTESLGNEEEDRAIERLATMLSNLKIRQIIVITHDQIFAQFADNTIQVRKTGNKSSII